MVLKLYKINWSPAARACMMACDLFNVPVEMVDIDLMKGEHLTPDFLKKNPAHTVPVLEDGDLILHESCAILMYLAEVYGSKQQSFYPKDLKQRALVNQMLFFNTSILFTRIRNISVPLLRDGVKPTEKTIALVDEAYGFLEEFLSRTKYVAGNDITIADLAVFSSTSGLSLYFLNVDVQKYPKIASWLKEMEQQPFAKQNAFAAEDLQLFHSRLSA